MKKKTDLHYIYLTINVKIIMRYIKIPKTLVPVTTEQNKSFVDIFLDINMILKCV